MRTWLTKLRGRSGLHAPTWSIRPTVSTEAVVLLSSLFFALVCNQLFWRTAMATHPGSIGFAVSLMTLLVGIHALLLGLLVWRWNAKPLVTLLLFTTALAAHYMDSYNVYLDADMLRNVLHTDHKESRELLTPGLIPPLVCYFLIPTVLLWRARLRARSVGKALLVRIGFLLAVAAVGTAGTMLSSQDISALMRNHRQVRYLATPINYIVALQQNLKSDSPLKHARKQPIEHDAMATPRAPGSRPRLLLVVLGETDRKSVV